MNIYEIAKSSQKKAVFDAVLEESCRQWCDGIENAPERKDGEGFADFFYEIFEDKEKEYVQQVKEMNGGRLPALQPGDKNYER